MHWHRRNSEGRYSVVQSLDIEATAEDAFEAWTRYEDFPRFMHSVRRTKRIDVHRVMWDVDLSGHQMVWEARITEVIPNKNIQWESCWGTCHRGEIKFEDIDRGQTRISVQIEYEPSGLREHLGARLGLVDDHVRADLERFRAMIEAHGRSENAQP